MDTTEDETVRLAACIAAGPAPEAEAALVRLLAPRVLRFGQRHLRDGTAAAQLVRQVMALTLEQLRGGVLRQPRDVLGLVLAACRLAVMDHRRGEGRRHDALLQRHAGALQAIGGEPPALLPAPADVGRLAGRLQRLSGRERAVVLMSCWDQPSAAALGARLDWPAQQVRTLRRRGFERLGRAGRRSAE